MKSASKGQVNFEAGPIARKKGTGRIYKEGRAFYCQSKINGQRKTKKLDALTLADARKETEKLSLIASAKSEEDVAFFAGKAWNVIRKHQQDILLEKAFDVFLKIVRRRDCSKDWLKIYRVNWDGFLAFLRSVQPSIKNLSEVTPALAEKWAENLLAPGDIKPKTYNTYVGLLKTFFKVLQPDNNPFHFISKLKNNSGSFHELSEEDIREIFDAVDCKMTLSLMHRNEMKVLFRLGVYTGLRLKDCCCLKWWVRKGGTTEASGDYGGK